MELVIGSAGEVITKEDVHGIGKWMHPFAGPQNLVL